MVFVYCTAADAVCIFFYCFHFDSKVFFLLFFDFFVCLSVMQHDSSDSLIKDDFIQNCFTTGAMNIQTISIKFSTGYTLIHLEHLYASTLYKCRRTNHKSSMWTDIRKQIGLK